MVTWKYADAVAQFSGDLDADVAFMTGRCKVEDAYARYVFDLRPVFGSPEWADGLLSDLAGSHRVLSRGPLGACFTLAGRRVGPAN